MWFIALLAIEFTIREDSDFARAHINYHLIEAENAESAYNKLILLGSSYNISYENRDGETIDEKFVGICDLVEIYEPLEDLSEIFYEEMPHRVG